MRTDTPCFVQGAIYIEAFPTPSFNRACGVVVSRPLSMQEAQGSIPCVSMNLCKLNLNLGRFSLLGQEFFLPCSKAASTRTYTHLLALGACSKTTQKNVSEMIVRAFPKKKAFFMHAVEQKTVSTPKAGTCSSLLMVRVHVGV